MKKTALMLLLYVMTIEFRHRKLFGVCLVTSSKTSIQNDDGDFFCVTFVCEDGRVKHWESHDDISRMEEWE